QRGLDLRLRRRQLVHVQPKTLHPTVMLVGHVSPIFPVCQALCALVVGLDPLGAAQRMDLAMWVRASISTRPSWVSTPKGLASTWAIMGSAFTYVMYSVRMTLEFFSSAARAASSSAAWADASASASRWSSLWRIASSLFICASISW